MTQSEGTARVRATRNLVAAPSPHDSTRVKIRSLLPHWSAVACTFVCLAVGFRPGAVLGLTAMLILAPVADRLGRRFLTGFLWLAFCFGAITIVPRFPMTAAGLSAVVLLTGLATALVRWHRAQAKALPRVNRPERLVVLGASLLAALLMKPIWGRSDEIVLLDVSRHYDNLPHYASVLAVTGGVEGFPRVPLYNYGYHAIHALLLSETPIGQGEVPVSSAAYAWMGIALTVVCAAAIGFLAVEMSFRITATHEPAQSWVTNGTGLAFLVAAPASGVLANFYAWGHTSFLWAATAVSVASWLALTSTDSVRWSTAFVVLGVVAAFTTYRSTQVGLSPAAFWVVWMSTPGARPWARWTLASTAAAVVFAGWLPFHYYRTSEPVLGASISEIGAGLAVPIPTVVLIILLLSLTVLVARIRSTQIRPLLKPLAPLAGFGAFALIIALELTRQGQPLDNYYLWKSASAIVLAGLPVLLVLCVWAFAPSRPNPLARILGVLGTIALVSLLAVAPHSGESLDLRPSGMRLLEWRQEQLDHPESGASILRATEIARQTLAPAVVLAPRSWGWSDRPEVASQWMNTLRGVNPAASGEAAACTGISSPSSLQECLNGSLAAKPGLVLTVIDARETWLSDTNTDGQLGPGISYVQVR